MRLVAFGGEKRIQGAIAAAQRAGWDATHVAGEDDLLRVPASADAVMLPWPRSFIDGKLAGCALDKENVIKRIPACGMLLHGTGIGDEELNCAEYAFDPAQDEAFLQVNAELTAEGAIARAMERPGRALLGSSCVVTGFGRIGQALARRLTALGAFVIVCARSEAQMRSAHAMGAHPVPLASLASACAQADVLMNTVPARIITDEAMGALRSDAWIIELASAPYGIDPKKAKQAGLQVFVESGLPGRYAPLDAGEALFDALLRRMAQQEKKREKKREEEEQHG